MWYRGNSQNGKDNKRMTYIVYILLAFGIVMMCMATLFHIIGMATPYWVKFPDTDSNYEKYFGLFETCSGYDVKKDSIVPVVCRDLEFGRISLKHRIVQVLSFLVLLTGLTGAGATIVLLLTVQLSTGVSKRTVISATAVAVIACLSASAFAFSVIGIFVDRLYRKNDEDGITEVTGEYGSSFMLCTMAAMLYPAGTFFVVAASRFVTVKGTREEQDRQDGPVEETMAMMQTEASD